MKKHVRAAALAAAVFLLAGCATSEASEPEPSESVAAAPSVTPSLASSSPCLPMATAPECGDTLTDLVLTAGAAFDALPDPSQEQVQADITLDHAGERWAATCQQQDGLLVAELDESCAQIIADLADAAVTIDPSLDG